MYSCIMYNGCVAVGVCVYMLTALLLFICWLHCTHCFPNPAHVQDTFSFVPLNGAPCWWLLSACLTSLWWCGPACRLVCCPSAWRLLSILTWHTPSWVCEQRSVRTKRDKSIIHYFDCVDEHMPQTWLLSNTGKKSVKSMLNLQNKPPSVYSMLICVSSPCPTTWHFLPDPPYIHGDYNWREKHRS